MEKIKLMVTRNLRNLRGAQNFVCPKCVQEEEGGGGNGDDEDVGFESRNMGIDKLSDTLCSCDHMMVRYMAGVKWQDRRSSIEAVEVCGVKDLSVELGRED
ncbi:hypothetical protein E2C01_060936 [Portunus trituberculatus]|uniref:Uncharacterized protein n=1 Tax=Portunus trituberculatus TaxID=210409 RepID=A0A5B7H9F6_PORTR|nr:hypothetical protein [Portunus trituberculatus]